MMITRLVGLVSLLPGLALAQGNGAKARAALAPFQRLVGVWEGDARVTLLPGAPPQIVRQREEFALGPGGTSMTVEMRATATDGPQKGNVVF